MADDPLDTLRLALMQEVLPVGMAMVDRAKEGGVSKVAEVFSSSDDPFELLRSEGEPAAKSLRDRLDKVSPGLGNPVVPVKVAVDQTSPQTDQTLDQEELIQVLDRIQRGMEELENLLFEFSPEDPTTPSEKGSRR